MKKRFNEVLRNSIGNSDVDFNEAMWLYHLRNLNIAIVCSFIAGIGVGSAIMVIFLK